MELNRMIKRQKIDVVALDEIDRLGVRSSKLNEFDFKDVAIVKPWGFEYLAFESDDKKVCAWVLHMENNGLGTSVHCHRDKKTFISVISGSIFVKTLDDSFRLDEGESVFIDKAVFHSMGALVDDTVLTEIESPSFKPDAVRYIDFWGREREEYESHCQIRSIDKVSCPYLVDDVLNMKIKDLVCYAEKIFAE